MINVNENYPFEWKLMNSCWKGTVLGGEAGYGDDE
jgi:hypothetical protein